MQCIHCQVDNDYRTRTAQNHRCKNCHRAFAFEPKTDPFKTTDPGFQKMMEGLSVEGQLFFTERQLWYGFNRRVRRQTAKSPWWWGIGLAILPLIMVYSAIQNDQDTLLSYIVAAIAAAIAGFGYAYWWNSRQITPKVSLDEFRQTYLQRWLSVHGKIDQLLPPAEKLDFGNGSSTKEPDLTDYSFDRLLVVDNDDLTAMLIANNFHLENRCAVLSANGYPQAIFNTLLTMLRRNANLTVFILHDAAPESLELPHRLRQQAWFPDPQTTIVDLGLRPKSVRQLRLLILKDDHPKHLSLTDKQREQLTKAEIKWLEAGNRAELSSLPPDTLIHALSRGVSQADQALATRHLPDSDDDRSLTTGLALSGGAAATAPLFLIDDPFEIQAEEERRAAAGGSWISGDFG